MLHSSHLRLKFKICDPGVKLDVRLVAKEYPDQEVWMLDINRIATEYEILKKGISPSFFVIKFSMRYLIDQ